MPIYQYNCPIHGIFEKYLPLSYSDRKSIPCTENIDCEKQAERILSLTGNIQIGAPTRIFINNKTGEVFTPFSKNDRPPKGYHERELRNPIERSQFEKEQQRRIDAENQLTSHALDEMKSEAVKKRHDDLKARMNAVQKETFTNKEGKEETIEFTLDHKDKALIKKAIEKTNKKPRKEKKSNAILAVNHYNPSNMDQVK